MGVKAVKLLSETVIALITIIMACLSFYASQARLFNPQSYGFIALIALFTILILFINIFLTLYWASKKRAWFFVSFATICLFIPYITTMFQVSLISPPPYKDKDICIVTYNVHNFSLDKDYKTNFQDIAFSLAEKDPDIICFQEFWKNKDYTIDSISKFLDMPYYSLGENGLGVTDLAIFSKYTIIKTESQIYAHSHNGSMFCDINVKGKEIRIINFHLQTTNINQQREEINNLKHIAEPRMFAQAVQSIYSTLLDNSLLRANQALAINNIIKTARIPIIACGDLNETPSSYVYNQVKGNLKDGFKEAGRGFGGTYKKIFKILRVDYIFHNKDFKCVNYFSESLDYSDHNPVFGFYKFN
jgi:endonuclease/exonuclease/phosphatase family metal-dependent hydrolase